MEREDDGAKILSQRLRIVLNLFKNAANDFIIFPVARRHVPVRVIWEPLKVVLAAVLLRFANDDDDDERAMSRLRIVKNFRATATVQFYLPIQISAEFQECRDIIFNMRCSPEPITNLFI